MLLNCGSKGVKFQMYFRGADKTIAAAKHYKPSNGDSFTRLQVEGSGYKPSSQTNEGYLTPQELEDSIGEGLAHAKNSVWKLDAAEPVHVVAFLTGSLRNFYERAEPKHQQQLDATIQQLFATLGVKTWQGPFWNNNKGRRSPTTDDSSRSSSRNNNKRASTSTSSNRSSYFISQKDEGCMELHGARKMYSQLVRKGKLPTDSTPVMTLGIGFGSTQWGLVTSPSSSGYDIIQHPFGMSNPVRLVDLGLTAAKYFRENSEAKRNFIDAVRTTKSPIIALKSGCLLLVRDEKFQTEGQRVLKQLFQRPNRKVLIFMMIIPVMI